MTPEEELQARRDQATMSALLKARARKDPRGAARGPQPSGYRTSAPTQPRDVEPYAPPPPSTADQMGGAVDDGAPAKSFGVNEGDQSMNDVSFGDLLENSDAKPLMDAVREHRASRLATAAPVDRAPTVGDAEAAQQQQAAQQAFASQIRFLVDTRTGHFTPIMPGEQLPQPGAHDVIVGLNEDPTNPDLIAKGKSVKPANVARLTSGKVQPKLHPDFQVPDHMAEALGPFQQQQEQPA